MREYFFNAPSQESLPQGMIWERFLKLTGEQLDLPKVKVGFAGSSLFSRRELLIEGSGVVGNRGFHYTFTKVSPRVANELGAALECASRQIRRESPSPLRRIHGVLYRL